MTKNNQVLAAAAHPVAILQSSTRVSEAAFDEAIRARLMHVVIGVGSAGKRDGVKRAAAITTAKTMTLIVDLSIHLSLAEHQCYPEGGAKNGVLLIPASFNRSTKLFDVDFWSAIEETDTRWKSVCATIYHSNVTHCDTFQSAVGDAFTLRLLFDAHGEGQATNLADELCDQFAASHRLTTSMREALHAIGSTLLEPQCKHHCSMRMRYVGAKVEKGWTKQIGDPASFPYTHTMEECRAEPRMPSELRDLFAARCEAVWSDTAKLLHALEPGDENPAEDDASSDAADEFVCAERMMTLWYGNKRRPRRQS